MALGVPRAAVLSDQQGNYVFVVDSQNRVEQRRIQLGQSSPETAVIMSGLKEGEMVIVEGIQRVRPGIQVTPGPAYPGPAGGATAQAGGGTSQAGGYAAGGQASGGGNGPAAAAATSPSSATPTSGSPAGAPAGNAGSAGTSSGH